jgi:phenylpropionate dioxygenase-like ring-hydroxylating dioxygenase large terminal subunit
MFKNFWYALAFSDEITATPSRHRILAQDLVLWRGPSGEVRALSDLCVHRGARLSEGYLQGDNIVCPYHGWGYGSDGACTVIPAQGRDRPVSKRARVDSYPVEERHGWIWVFMGDLPEADRVPIPDLSFMDDPTYRSIRGEWHWDANYERVVENGTDQSHTPFVHGGVFGNPDEPEVGDFEVETGEWWARLSVEQKSPKKPSSANPFRRTKYEGDPPPVFVRTAFFFPSIVMIDLTIPNLGRQVIWDTNIPVDEDTTLTKWISMRNFFTSPWADRVAKKMVYKVFSQDDVVVKEIRPELIPEEMNGELHLRSDQMSIEYRKIRQKAVDLGYSVRGTAEGEKNKRSIIASPYRREPELVNAWVLPETPEGLTQRSN